MADDDPRKIIDMAEELQKRRLDDSMKSVPDFIKPEDIPMMTDGQLEQTVNMLQLRRLQSTTLYEATMRQRGEVTQSKARESLDHKAGQVWRELERAKKVMDKLELRVNEMRALRIQAGLDWGP